MFWIFINHWCSASEKIKKVEVEVVGDGWEQGRPSCAISTTCPLALRCRLFHIALHLNPSPGLLTWEQTCHHLHNGIYVHGWRKMNDHRFSSASANQCCILALWCLSVFLRRSMSLFASFDSENTEIGVTKPGVYNYLIGWSLFNVDPPNLKKVLETRKFAHGYSLLDVLFIERRIFHGRFLWAVDNT